MGVAETNIIEEDDIVTTIVKESNVDDLTIVGATWEGLLNQFVFSAVAEQIGGDAKNTVIMAKRNNGITAKRSRWFRR